MKRKFSVLVLAIFAMAEIAFAQDYMDKIATDACECLSSVSDEVDTERYNLEIGICMLNAAEPYKKKLKKDHNIDFNQIDTQGEELGRLIGMRMASVCPQALLKMANNVGLDEEEAVEENSFFGHVTKIEGDIFLEFSIRDTQGKTSKFYWFTFIESNIDLAVNYKTLVDKSVRIDAIPQEIFDARIGEYRTVNVITKIKLVGV